MASINIPTVILFCKHTIVHILHTKCGIVAKGHSAPFCICLLPRKPILDISMFVVRYFVSILFCNHLDREERES